MGTSLGDVILEEWVGICQADQREKRRALGRGAGKQEPVNLSLVEVAGTLGSQGQQEPVEYEEGP